MNDALHTPGSAENPENDIRFQGLIRPARLEDLAAIRPILERWVFDRETGTPLPDEVDDVMRGIQGGIDGTLDRTYVVAEDPEGQVVGLMGLIPVSEKMVAFTTSPNAGELINADIADNQRRKGVGRALKNTLEAIAMSRSYDEIVVNSGPRYESTGWPFWEKMYGPHVGIAKDLYGPGGDARVWRHALIPEA